jgi:hypothetical protein
LNITERNGACRAGRKVSNSVEDINALEVPAIVRVLLQLAVCPK